MKIICFVDTRHQMHKRTFKTVAFYQHCSMFTALHYPRLNGQIQSTLFITFGMALEAILAQNRLYIRNEVDRSFGGGWKQLRKLVDFGWGN